MKPDWLSLRTSVGGRPNSLFSSASEYCCISPSGRFSGRRGVSGCRRFLGRLALFDFGSLGTSGIQTRFEHFHQIDDIGWCALDGWFGEGYFLALYLPLDRSLHPGTMLVN